MEPLRWIALGLSLASGAACLHPVHGGEPFNEDGGGGEGGFECPNAPAPDGGTWSIAGFATCDCRCPGGTVPATPAPPACPTCYACACGLGHADLAAGCALDDDCVLAPADCCGCEQCGSSIGVRGTNLGLWLTGLSAACGTLPGHAGPDGGGCTPTTPCPSGACGAARAACVAGRCVAQF